jgi:hypothetical protein
MSEEFAINLYDLLPALYRLRDVEQGRALEALLNIISKQVDILKQDIDGLWDDMFIETCADWVIPYIGDLVGNNPLHEVAQRRRVDVAKTIYYRRRKGTLPMLEELARDVTGWGAHVVAFFELLGWTQNLNHLRYNMAPNPMEQDPEAMKWKWDPSAVDRVGTVNLRNLDVLDRLDGPFDIISHTADLRPIGRLEGWHNVRNIGFFLWRLKNYPLAGVIPCRANNECCFHFSPLGNPAPLFNSPVREADEAVLAGEVHVPGPIRPAAFHFNIADYYGPDKSLAIYEGLIADENKLIPISRIVCKDLSSWSQPKNGRVAIDVRLGRIAFPSNEVPDEGICVQYNYGFSSDMGGGPYDRLETVTDQAMVIWRTTIGENANYASISDALNAWNAWVDDNDGDSRYAVITFMDNGTYEEEIKIEASDNSFLVIQVGKDHASNRFRPALKGNITLNGDNPYASLSLNGLLIEGGINVQGSLRRLEVNHCTLVPGGSLTEKGEPGDSNYISIDAGDSNERLEVDISSSIMGKIRLPAEMRSLTVRDSIVDAFGDLAIAGHDTDIQYGPPTTIERTTVLGEVRVKELSLASESIFSGNVEALRKQAGCVRFCYLPDIGSQTPRRYRCQPDLALAGHSASEKALIRARLVPSFTSKSYGTPGYCQLSLNCAREIRTGAENGSEMGAFCRLMQPQRETNLRIRLEEYLPFGLEAGIIYVT